MGTSWEEEGRGRNSIRKKIIKENDEHCFRIYEI
jgi:hypothetical protein